jgi:hypothetical protein
MADHLLTGQFADGAFFHLYHSLECISCGLLVQLEPNEALPATHNDRIFEALDVLEAIDNELTTQLLKLHDYLNRRSEALYVGWRGTKVREPHQQFLLEDVQDMAQELRPALARVEALLQTEAP